MSVEVTIEGVQDKIAEKAKDARHKGRKMTLAALGIVGLTYDAGKSLVHRADEFVSRAEKRGEEIEAVLNARVSEVQDQMTEEAKAQRAKVEGALKDAAEGVGGRSAAIQEKFQSGLSSLKAGSGTIIETDDIKIEVEIVDDLPWEDYDDLNAQEILDRLSDLSEEQLESLRKYEQNTKNRVTVLREIEIQQAGRDMEATAEEDDVV
jgi:hypothetical protein